MAHSLQPRGGRWDDFRVTKRLGSGAQGTVYLCTPSAAAEEQHALGGDDVVVKSVFVRDASEKEVSCAMQEASILSHMRHANIVRYYDCFLDADGCLCTVMEFCSGGDLSSHVRRNAASKTPFASGMVRSIAEQMLSALVYLRVRKVMHRDVKPANILIDDSGSTRLTDFGLSRLLDTVDAGAGTFAGTPHYLCPEICLGERYDYASDVWALGVTLYEVMALRVPFGGNNILAIVNKVTDGEYEPLADAWDQDLRELVRDMLVADPTARPAARSLMSTYFPCLLDATLKSAHSGAAGVSPLRHRDAQSAASVSDIGVSPTARSVITSAPSTPGPRRGSDPLADPQPASPADAPHAGDEHELPLAWLQRVPRCDDWDALQARIREKAFRLQQKRLMLRFKRQEAQRYRLNPDMASPQQRSEPDTGMDAAAAAPATESPLKRRFLASVADRRRREGAASPGGDSAASASTDPMDLSASQRVAIQAAEELLGSGRNQAMGTVRRMVAETYHSAGGGGAVAAGAGRGY
eukprot:TRINITY_DN20398_c0_g1_i1.p1 TRINITY_DN20398_c0_g1~~TRINITY_DN20398_c0_g1_i1.p1  ORF type:complete len:542 (+),score=163.07 TRINITY_DN20398_c0_g1_i1:56-1627(+)